MFTASQFVPTAHSTAADKAKFANHFVKFVSGGFRRHLWVKWFYSRVSCCGHIAHYNIEGFWDEWFSDSEKQERFIARWRDREICGDPAYTYSDVERVLAAWLQETHPELPLFPTFGQKVGLAFW